MQKKIMLLFTLLAGIVFLCYGTNIYAGTKANDIIEMNNKAYPKHKKSIVKFTHKKHAQDYKIGCGECHHDENNKPLNNLKEGDDVKSCIECHSKPALIKRKNLNPQYKKQKREYHANAIHGNCKACHKKFNKKKGLKSKDKGAAPTTCKACHPKKK